MIVVSDTTPLNYLILVDSVHVLPGLFVWVYAPSAVITRVGESLDGARPYGLHEPSDRW